MSERSLLTGGAWGALLGAAIGLVLRAMIRRFRRRV
jgi:NhaP-type Na+/H+ or K+/H+ antiporter